MKKGNRTFYGISMWMMICILLSSCNTEDVLTETELFTGIYTGTISYGNGENQQDISDASVQSIQSGENYSFDFPSDIPSIENIPMLSNGETLMNLDATATHLIRVTATSLQIIWSEGEQTWHVQSTRN